MPARFADMEEEANVDQGRVVRTMSEWRAIVSRAEGRPPFLAELEHETGSVLALGVAPGVGVAQFTDREGISHLAVASVPPSVDDDVEFLCGGTPTPFHARWILTCDLLDRIVARFLESGEALADVSWELI